MQANSNPVQRQKLSKLLSELQTFAKKSSYQVLAIKNSVVKKPSENEEKQLEMVPGGDTQNTQSQHKVSKSAAQERPMPETTRVSDAPEEKHQETVNVELE